MGKERREEVRGGIREEIRGKIGDLKQFSP